MVTPRDEATARHGTGLRAPATHGCGGERRSRATRLAEWQAEISAFVSKRGGAYVQVPADIELTDLLFDVLRRRRVVE